MRIVGIESVEQRYELIKAVEGGMKVTEACRVWNISRPTYYFWRDRYRSDGIDGLKDRTTKPSSSPNQIPWTVESDIVEMRKAHYRWGARRIRAELKRKGVTDLPARSTVHGVLVRNDLVVKTVAPVKALKRFQLDSPGELVQTDAKDVVLTTDQTVHIFSVLDDCSRLCQAAEVCEREEASDAIAVMTLAIKRYGAPYSVLSDRGTCFTGITTKGVGPFERYLWKQGVFTINGSPYHPQTQGKVERYHRTLSEWLEDNGPYEAVEQLQSSVDEFRDDYNNDRPHQAIDDLTPAEKWASLPQRHVDPEGTVSRRVRKSVRTTGTNGNFTYSEWIIALGKTWSKTAVTLVDYGTTIEVRDSEDNLIRTVTPDPTRRYLGTGKTQGRPSVKKTG